MESTFAFLTCWRSAWLNGQEAARVAAPGQPLSKTQGPSASSWTFGLVPMPGLKVLLGWRSFLPPSLPDFAKGNKETEMLTECGERYSRQAALSQVM